MSKFKFDRHAQAGFYDINPLSIDYSLDDPGFTIEAADLQVAISVEFEYTTQDGDFGLSITNIVAGDNRLQSLAEDFIKEHQYELEAYLSDRVQMDL